MLRLAVLFVLLACSLATTSCGGDIPATGEVAAVTGSTEIVDQGDFEIVYLDPASETDAVVKDLLSGSDLELLVDDINQAINLRRDVSIVFGPGPEIASYLGDPSDTSVAGYVARENTDGTVDPLIVYSYEYVLETISRFRKFDKDYIPTLDCFEEAILPNIEHTLLHEIGHALIHVNDIKPNGENEEVMADELAFFIVTDSYDSPEDFLPVVTHYRYREQEGDAREPSPHPQDATRAENYLCWVYGSDPETFDVLKTGYMQRKSDECEDAYWRLWDSWEARLDPSWKEAAEPDPEEYFHYLIEENDATLDEAINEIAESYAPSVAVDLAVYLCAPEPDPECAGSEVQKDWDAFLQLIGEGSTVDRAVSELADKGYDLPILEGIAVSWCSPEPGPGCSADGVFTQAWKRFDEATARGASPGEAISLVSDGLAEPSKSIAEVMGVFVCGHPTCYDRTAVFASADPAEQPALRSQELQRVVPKRGAAGPPPQPSRQKKR